MKSFSGLTEADAAARLQAEGHNELPQSDRRTLFRIAIEVLREPMLLLLVGGIAAVAVILALTLLWPFASRLFAFGPLHVDDLALTLGAGFIALPVLEMLKPLLRPWLQPQTRPSQPLRWIKRPSQRRVKLVPQIRRAPWRSRTFC